MHPKDACLNLDLGSLSLDQHLGVFVKFLEQFLSCFCAVAECEAAADTDDCCCEGRYVVDNKAQVGGMCKSNIHRDGRTQGLWVL